MDFAVSCPLVRRWRLVSGFCPSTRTFDPCFFQTPPRGGSPCIISRPSPPSGWPKDFHLQAAEHAQHTTKPLMRRTPAACIIWQGDCDATKSCVARFQPSVSQSRLNTEEAIALPNTGRLPSNVPIRSDPALEIRRTRAAPRRVTPDRVIAFIVPNPTDDVQHDLCQWIARYASAQRRPHCERPASGATADKCTSETPPPLFVKC